MRVFILDDDPIFLTVMEGLLGAFEGVEALCETSGDVALQRIAELAQTIDLVISDLNMPGVDGLSFLRGLSELQFRQPVVLITGEREAIRNSAQHLAGNFGLNIISAIKKPIDLLTLQKTMRLAREKAAGAAPVANSKNDQALEEPFEPQLFYQPQVDIHQGRTVGAEALVRGLTESGRVVGAGSVLAAFSEVDARFELTCKLFAMLCRDIHRMRGSAPEIQLSFNVDTYILERRDFIGTIVAMAREAGVDPRRITMELTEKQLSADTDALLEKVARLGMAGFATSLDDFGTGASNYDLLRQGAFDELKIDHSIIQRIDSDPMSARFVNFAVDVTRSRGTHLVAEGVEDRDCLTSLKVLGVRRMQGYFFSRPIAFDAFTDFLANESALKLAR